MITQVGLVHREDSINPEIKPVQEAPKAGPDMKARILDRRKGLSQAARKGSTLADGKFPTVKGKG